MFAQIAPRAVQLVWALYELHGLCIPCDVLYVLYVPYVPYMCIHVATLLKYPQMHAHCHNIHVHQHEVHQGPHTPTKQHQQSHTTTKYLCELLLGSFPLIFQCRCAGDITQKQLTCSTQANAGRVAPGVCVYEVYPHVLLHGMCDMVVCRMCNVWYCVILCQPIVSTDTTW